MTGEKVGFIIRTKPWINNPQERWNAGLIAAGNAWRAENEDYPSATGWTGISANSRTGALGHKSTFRIIDEGKTEELSSTFYWKFLMYGTGVYGPKGTPIRPKTARFLAWRTTGGNKGHLKIASGVGKRKGKIVAKPKKDVFLVFARSVLGTIWYGKLDSIKTALKDALRDGIRKYKG